MSQQRLTVSICLEQRDSLLHHLSRSHFKIYVLVQLIFMRQKVLDARLDFFVLRHFKVKLNKLFSNSCAAYLPYLIIYAAFFLHTEAACLRRIWIKHYLKKSFLQLKKNCSKLKNHGAGPNLFRKN